MVNPKYLIGVDLGGTHFRVAAVSLSGQISLKVKKTTNVSSGYAHVVKKIRSTIKSIIRKKGMAPVAVGLASAGAIDAKKMMIVSSPNFPEWELVLLAKDVGEDMDFPVYLDNDANAAVLGEGWTGAARKWKNFAMFTLGTGVGGGIVINGDCWRGPDGMAGELGHLVIHPGGRECGCGNRGCLETTASANGVALSGQELISAHRLKTGRVSAQLVASLAQGGDDRAKSILNRAGADLGIAIAQIALTLDVTMFVIGGGMAPALGLMRRSMRKSALANAYTLTPARLKIVETGLGDDAGMIGAARSAMIRFGAG